MAILTKIPDPNASVGDFPEILAPDGQLTGSVASAITQAVRALMRRLNNGLSLGNGVSGYQAGNLDAQYIDVLTPGVADTAIEVPHDLGRVPIGYEVVRRDKAAVVYDADAGSWNERRFYVKANVASVTVKLRVY